MPTETVDHHEAVKDEQAKVDLLKNLDTKYAPTETPTPPGMIETDIDLLVKAGLVVRSEEADAPQDEVFNGPKLVAVGEDGAAALQTLAAAKERWVTGHDSELRRDYLPKDVVVPSGGPAMPQKVGKRFPPGEAEPLYNRNVQELVQQGVFKVVGDADKQPDAMFVGGRVEGTTPAAKKLLAEMRHDMLSSMASTYKDELGKKVGVSGEELGKQAAEAMARGEVDVVEVTNADGSKAWAISSLNKPSRREVSEMYRAQFTEAANGLPADQQEAFNKYVTEQVAPRAAELRVQGESYKPVKSVTETAAEAKARMMDEARRKLQENLPEMKAKVAADNAARDKQIKNLGTDVDAAHDKALAMDKGARAQSEIYVAQSESIAQEVERRNEAIAAQMDSYQQMIDVAPSLELKQGLEKARDALKARLEADRESVRESMEGEREQATRAEKSRQKQMTTEDTNAMVKAIEKSFAKESSWSMLTADMSEGEERAQQQHQMLGAEPFPFDVKKLGGLLNRNRGPKIIEQRYRVPGNDHLVMVVQRRRKDGGFLSQTLITTEQPITEKNGRVIVPPEVNTTIDQVRTQSQEAMRKQGTSVADYVRPNFDAGAAFDGRDGIYAKQFAADNPGLSERDLRRQYNRNLDAHRNKLDRQRFGFMWWLPKGRL